MKIPRAHFVWAQLGIYSISGTGPTIPERTHSLNYFSFNNGSKGYLYRIKQVVKSVYTQLNVIIGGKYACLE